MNDKHTSRMGTRFARYLQQKYALVTYADN